MYHCYQHLELKKQMLKEIKSSIQDFIVGNDWVIGLQKLV